MGVLEKLKELRKKAKKTDDCWELVNQMHFAEYDCDHPDLEEMMKTMPSIYDEKMKYGFYWVKYEGEWTIGEFCKSDTEYPWFLVRYEIGFTSDELEIGDFISEPRN
jgi:hypothetical protein